MQFASKYRGLRVVIIPKRTLIDNAGNRVLQEGKAAKFENGLFETEDKEIIEALKKNKYYGIYLWAINEPSQPKEETKTEIAQHEKIVEDLVTACPFCPFKAVNNFGLKSHIRAKHPDKASQ